MITVYNKINGVIVKTSQCSQSDIPLQYDPATESYIEGNYDYNKYYIQDNQPVAIPEAPDQYYKFNYDTKQWIDPRTSVTQWVVVKSQRKQLLVSSDWTQLPDVAIATKEAWAAYRQLLRDITLQSDPFNITWPTPPGA